MGSIWTAVQSHMSLSDLTTPLSPLSRILIYAKHQVDLGVPDGFVRSASSVLGSGSRALIEASFNLAYSSAVSSISGKKRLIRASLW